MRALSRDPVRILSGSSLDVAMQVTQPSCPFKTPEKKKKKRTIKRLRSQTNLSKTAFQPCLKQKKSVRRFFFFFFLFCFLSTNNDKIRHTFKTHIFLSQTHRVKRILHTNHSKEEKKEEEEKKKKNPNKSTQHQKHLTFFALIKKKPILLSQDDKIFQCLEFSISSSGVCF